MRRETDSDVRPLFDQNLSHRLVSLLADQFPGSRHVRDLGLERVEDAVVWSAARAEGFAIVSKDADFHQRSFLYGSPPKVIWIRRGNCTTKAIELIIRGNHASVVAFVDDETGAFLELL